MVLEMDVNQLVIFAKVAEGKSFTKAAIELGIEKSTVSSKISSLEKRLGLRLLNRTTRLVTLTEAGEGYYQYCRHIVETVWEASHYAQTLSNEPTGVLRISVSLDYGQLLIRQFLNSFMRTYPNLKIDLYVTDREVNLIEERYDVALRAAPGVLQDSSLIGRKLFDVQMGIFASPAFVDEYGEPETLNDLSNFPFIVFTKKQESIFEYSPGFVPDVLQISGNIKINDLLSCKEAALSSLGITILPIDSVCNELETGKLKRLLPEFQLPVMALFVVYPSRQWMSSKLKVFLQHLDQWKQHGKF